MTVAFLVVLIWTAVLLPPAIRAHARRRADFVSSFNRLPDSPPSPGFPGDASRARAGATTRAARRRQILAGLLVAMAATLVAGLLPPFRVLLVVHLFLVDSFLAYVTALVHLRRRHDAAVVPARGRSRRRAGPSLIRLRGTRSVPARPPVLAGAWPD